MAVFFLQWIDIGHVRKVTLSSLAGYQVFTVCASGICPMLAVVQRPGGGPHLVLRDNLPL
jgi:hypothetical protein